MVCSPLGKEADTPGRVLPRDAGLGLRAGDTAWAGTRGVGVVVVHRLPGESRWVPGSEGRGFRAGVPPNTAPPGLLAGPPGAGRGVEGDTPESRDEIHRGGRRGVSGCRGAGVGWGESSLQGAPPGGGAGSVGRVCLWTRRAPRSLGPPRLPFRSRRQALQAALSPPPRAFSPVRSRARAARGAGRRRREQPVV